MNTQLPTQLQRLKQAVYSIYHNPLTPAPIKESILTSCDLIDFTPEDNVESVTHAEGVQVMNNGDWA